MSEKDDRPVSGDIPGNGEGLLTPKIREKRQHLHRLLREMGHLAIAFSAGVDSTFLLYEAFTLLGKDVLAVTAESAAFPKKEMAEADRFCREKGIGHIRVSFREMEVAGFRENPIDRCYHCKTALMTGLKKAAEQEGFTILAEGSNMDDLGDYRPGLKAVEELGLRSPLREAGLGKAEIRIISKALGLDSWDKPSFACLASRFTYGEAITPERLAMVEKAEDYLASLGLRQYRVRVHGRLARIEAEPADIPGLAAAETAGPLEEYFRSLGFRYVTLDLKGYRTGSMNTGSVPPSGGTRTVGTQAEA